MSPAEPSSPYAARVRTILSRLEDQGILTAEEVQTEIEDMDRRTPALGAKAVARAWVDPTFQERLLHDAPGALSELGIEVEPYPKIVAVANTPTVHNVIVCTLCSCYPRALLGLPPAWYKSLEYRARTVREPRRVLQEFGLELSADVAVRVYDSTADIRYFVVPQRPVGTDGMSEAALADLVSVESLVGVAQAAGPR